jgi:hypothetical protein
VLKTRPTTGIPRVLFSALQGLLAYVSIFVSTTQLLSNPQVTEDLQGLSTAKYQPRMDGSTVNN